jgi:hypothetical protein
MGILAVAPAALSFRSRQPEDQLAITGVTVIDVATGRRVPDQTVVVRGSRIVSVSHTGRIRMPADAHRIDGRGKYLIPGLWDMHAHALTDNRSGYAFPLLIANGVTGIREMGSNMSIDSVNQIRRDVESHRVPGPRFGALTYRIVDGSPTTLRTAYEVSDPLKAREIVREYKRKGADFIKPYNQLRRDVYLALTDEARKQRIPLEGHVPFSITVREASDLGQRTIEHNWDVLLSVSAKEDSLRREFAAHPELWGPIEAKAAASYDERKAKRLFIRFARNHTWSCPTVAFYRIPILIGSDSAARVDSLMKYVPRAARDIWSTNFQRLARMSLPGYRQVHYAMRSRIVRDEQQAGVGILAGTDAGAAYSVHGFSLHDELDALVVDARLSPLDALRAATINPARFLGRERDLGTIEKGKLADLVLLDANPLERISNTRRISAVIADGRYFPREALNALLARAAAISNGQR